MTDEEIKQEIVHDVAKLNADLRAAAERGLHIEVAESTFQVIGMREPAPQLAVELTRVQRI